jgi:hypothetical protein
MRVETCRRLTWIFIGLMLAGSAVGILVPAGLGWDFANFYDAGRRAAAGQIDDVYDAGSLIAGQPPQGQMRFWGTPISAFLYVPLGAFSPVPALVLFKTQNVLAYAGALLLLFVFYRRFLPPGEAAFWRFAAIFTGAALTYQPFWTVFRVGGQTTATVLLLTVAGLLLHTAGRLWGSATCVAAAALIKPALAPAVLFLAVVSGPRFWWRIALVFGAIGVLSVGLLGWSVHQAFLHRVLSESQATFPWYHNSSLFIVPDTLRDRLGPALGDTLFTLVRASLNGAVLGTLAVLLWTGRRQRWTPAARRHFHFTLAILVFLLWSPTLWEHYLGLLFPFLVLLVATRHRLSRAARSLAASIFALSLAQNLILMDWLRRQFSFETIGPLLAVVLVKSGPLWLTLLLLWRHRDDLLRAHSDFGWAEPARLGVPVRRAS